MNGLQNSSPNDPRKRSPFTWVAGTTYPPTCSLLCLADHFLLRFEMLYIGSGVLYFLCLLLFLLLP